MKSLHDNRWKILLLFSVILPIGLFASFKVTGIFSQPKSTVSIAQTITANNTLYWSSERPIMGTGINDNLSSDYAGDVNVSQNVWMMTYYGNYDWGPGVALMIRVNASVASGYVYEMNFTAQPLDSPKTQLGYYPSTAGGLLSEGLNGIGSMSPDGSTFEAVGYGANKTASLLWDLEWGCHGPENETYTLGLTSQVAYYNGSIFKCVVQDYLLKLQPSCSNTYATAVELQPGNYTRLYLGEQPEAAYYKIYANSSQHVTVDINGLIPESDLTFYTTIYSPDGSVYLSTQNFSCEYSADFIANSTGYWIIRIAPAAGSCGFYSIGVNVN